MGGVIFMVHSPPARYDGDMTQLILHIGHPKTGTTALQRGYLHQRKALAERGILYPFLNKESDRHSALTPALIGKDFVPGDVAFFPQWPGDDVIGQSRHMWADVQAQIAAHEPHTVVLSGEGFFTLQRRWQMEEMCKVLQPVFDKITVVAYLRSPQARFLSLYQQGLKTAGSRQPLYARAYMPVLSVWNRYGPGELKLHVFDRKQLIGGDVAEDFATRYTPDGLDLIQARGERELNQSLSAEAMAVLESLNDRVEGMTPEESRLAWTPLREIMLRLDRTVPGYTRPRLLAEANDLIQRRSMDLRWLREDHGITFDDVDYRIVSTEESEGNRPVTWRPVITELCQIDQKRQARLAREMRRAMELEKLIPTTLINRILRKLRRG